MVWTQARLAGDIGHVTQKIWPLESVALTAEEKNLGLEHISRA